MALPSSGSITMAMIATELGISPTGLSLNDSRVRTLAGVPSGAISMAILYGKQNGPTYQTIEITTGIDNGNNVGINTVATPYSSEVFGSFQTNGTLSFGTLIACYWLEPDGGDGDGIYLDISGVSAGALIELKFDDGNTNKPIIQLPNKQWYYFDMQDPEDSAFVYHVRGMTDGSVVNLGFRKV